MVKAVRKYKRVFQTGAQFRSSPNVRRACELVRNGRLGEIRTVRTWVAPNSFEGPGPGWKPMPVPEGFDYDFWLGPAPEAPYHVERCFHRWRYILDYSNGQTVNFGAHTNDIAQWGLEHGRHHAGRVRGQRLRVPAQGEPVHRGHQDGLPRPIRQRHRTVLRDAQEFGDQVRRHRRPAGDHPRRQPEDVPREPQGLGDRTERDPLAAEQSGPRRRMSGNTSTRITSATSSTPSRAGRIRSSRWKSATAPPACASWATSPRF